MSAGKVTLEVLSGILGVPDDKKEAFAKGELTTDEFQTFFNGTYIGREAAKTDDEIVGPAVSKELGRYLNTIEQAAEKGWKELGVDIGEDERKDGDKRVPTVKLIELAFSKTKGIVDEAVASVGKDESEKLKSLEGQMEKIKGERDHFQTGMKEAIEEKDRILEEKTNEVLTFKTNSEHTRIFNSINWKEGISDLEKKGLEATMNEKYNRSWDAESDKMVLTYKEDGKPVYNEQGSEVLAPEQVYQKEVSENNLMRKNNTDGGTGTPRIQITGDPGGKPEPKNKPARRAANA